MCHFSTDALVEFCEVSVEHCPPRGFAWILRGELNSSFVNRSNTVMKLCLELARLAGTETREKTIEPDSLQYLRLPADYIGKMTSRIESYCLEASTSQSLYTRISMKQWLLTAIKSNRSRFRVTKRKADLEICNNVVPRLAYLKRLEGVMATCGGEECSPGGFLPISVLRGGDPPRQRCTNCALAEQLMKMETDRMAADEADGLRELLEDDLKSMKHIGGASEGDISTMLWRKGTVFIRKRFRRNHNFERELEVAETVSHPNIVHCFGRSCRESTNCDLFMEFLEEDLECFLNDGARTEGRGSPFSFRDSLDVLLQIAEAMKQLHEKNFVHGDLKPGNILVSKLTMPHSNVPFYLIKVADFGCAQRVDSSESFDFLIGTLKYTAPEVLSYRKHRGPPPENLQKIDVYSFGIVAYQVLSGLTTSTLYEGFPDYKEGLIRPDTDKLQCRPNRIWNKNSGTAELVYLERDRSMLLLLIETCWASSPQCRPAFPEICREILSLY